KRTWTRSNEPFQQTITIHSYALHDRSYSHHRLAARTRIVLHDGRVHTHSARGCHRGRSRPRDSRQSSWLKSATAQNNLPSEARGFGEGKSPTPTINQRTSHETPYQCFSHSRFRKPRRGREDA